MNYGEPSLTWSNLWKNMLIKQKLKVVMWQNHASTSKQNIGNRTPLSDGQKKEIYQDVQFFHGAIQLHFSVIYQYL